MIPDLALLRDKAPGRFRRFIYTVLSLGWRGTEREWRRLRVALGLMAFVIIPIAVSVHSIVSWDFAMSVMPMWHSTIFAPYFVIGAIYSGTALVVTIMVLLRWVFHLESVPHAAALRQPGQDTAHGHHRSGPTSTSRTSSPPGTAG